MVNYIFLSFLILISVILNTSGQTLLKLGSGQNPLNIYLIGGLFAYALSTIFYIVVLGKINLSIAYPVVVGLTIITTTLAGAVFLKEQVPISHWVGIGLILSGVSTLASFKGS